MGAARLAGPDGWGIDRLVAADSVRRPQLAAGSRPGVILRVREIGSRIESGSAIGAASIRSEAGTEVS